MKRLIRRSLAAMGVGGLCWLATTATGAGTNYVSDTAGDDGYGGGGWGDAWATISNAVALSSADDLILVSNGTYAITAEIMVNKGVTIRGFSGDPADTIVDGQNTVRCFNLADSAATLQNLTITNGRVGTGAGVNISVAGTVSNCVITSCVGTSSGGGVALAGTGGLVVNSVIRDSTAQYTGGGVYINGAGTVRNCLIIGNRAITQRGGGVYHTNAGGLIENCTVVDNQADDGGGGIFFAPAGGYADSTICYFNRTGTTTLNGNDGKNTDAFSSGAFKMRYCCTIPVHGTGSTADNPLLVDYPNEDFRLLPGSPCTNSGQYETWMDTGLDLDGNDRLDASGLVDIGAYEYHIGALDCNFSVDPAVGFSPTNVVLTAYVAGTNLTSVHYYWDVDGNGSTDVDGTDKQVVTQHYASAGSYTITLTVSNAVGEADSITHTDAVQLAPSTVYVVPTSSGTYPYDSWDKATSNLQAAVDVCVDGTLLLVTNGTYVLTNTVSITAGVEMRSVNGAAVTLFDGNDQPWNMFVVNHEDAILDGFTIRNCGTAISDGAAVIVGQSTVRNCRILNNVSTHSHSNGGMSANEGLVENCIFMGNRGGAHAGGGMETDGGTVIRNCLFAGNRVDGSSNTGAAIKGSGAIIENCTIVKNAALGGAPCSGGVFGSHTLRNCIVYHNESTDSTNHTSEGTFQHVCTEPPRGTDPVAGPPLLVNLGTGAGLTLVGGDFNLRTESPCHDAGDSTLSWLSGALDLNGQDRIEGDDVDLGCYEWYPPTGSVVVIR